VVAMLIFGDMILQVYTDNRARISQVKSNLAVSGLRFKDMSWRLDVEV
jgi:hypothetical protein